MVIKHKTKFYVVRVFLKLTKMDLDTRLLVLVLTLSIVLVSGRNHRATISFRKQRLKQRR